MISFNNITKPIILGHRKDLASCLFLYLIFFSRTVCPCLYCPCESGSCVCLPLPSLSAAQSLPIFITVFSSSHLNQTLFLIPSLSSPPSLFIALFPSLSHSTSLPILINIIYSAHLCHCLLLFPSLSHSPRFSRIRIQSILAYARLYGDIFSHTRHTWT